MNTRQPVDHTFYVDESGIPNTGLALYTALGVPTGRAPEVLRIWRDLRDQWYHEYGVPTDFELHATNFLSGRGRPGGRNPAKIERYRMAQAALDVIGAQPSLSIVTVYTEEPAHWGRAKRQAYEGLLRRLDGRLAEVGERAALVVDGDGSERLYEQVHQQVGPRCIPFAAAEVPAHNSALIQMADVVAHTACQAIARQHSRRFMWSWYSRHLPKAPAPERY
ncbi:DUF3800 domain-containing protein [Streptomyces sp. HUAS 31]|uniref:DUF3800 domain-containing protein n=1 Tax=Streptomyces sp. HUAS 31 TaxID=3020055 RepID=UPI0023064C67|nr:DUF3800 domain-containing protein [Streptomyces sp. HUAS 31]WCE02226.1 DUF3800 domain-containing protein [Streptomyces sp. HUAS 31]